MFCTIYSANILLVIIDVFLLCINRELFALAVLRLVNFKVIFFTDMNSLRPYAPLLTSLAVLLKYRDVLFTKKNSVLIEREITQKVLWKKILKMD